MPAILELALAADHRPEVYPARLHGAACALLGHPADGERPAFSTHPLRQTGTHPSWRLGWLAPDPCPRQIESVTFGPITHRVAGLALREWGFAELAAAPPRRRVVVDVLSPMYFSRGDRDHPAPDALLATRSLLDRWDDHAPAGLTVPEERRRSLLSTVYLAAFDGRTVEGPVGTSTFQTGFVGSMTLALTRKADDGVAALFGAVMRFAEIAGIGAQTGHGFGAVTVRAGTDPAVPLEKRRGPRVRVVAGGRA